MRAWKVVSSVSTTQHFVFEFNANFLFLALLWQRGRLFTDNYWNFIKHNFFRNEFLSTITIVERVLEIGTENDLAKCKKCGNSFLFGSKISDYCRTCLEKFPELNQRAISCTQPMCNHYRMGSPFKNPFGIESKNHCFLKKKRIIIPIINCGEHTSQRKL